MEQALKNDPAGSEGRVQEKAAKESYYILTCSIELTILTPPEQLPACDA